MRYIAILFAAMLAFAWHQTPARAADQGSAPAQAQQGDQNASPDNGQQMDDQQQTDPEPAVDNGQTDDQSDEGHQIDDNNSDAAE